MRFHDLISFIEKSENSGLTFDDIKSNFSDVENDMLKQFIQSGLDLKELHKNGKGRGTRYYSTKFEIVEIFPDIVAKVDNNKCIDGAIDVSKCANVKEKVDVILKSDHPLSRPINFSYRERILDKLSNRELRDFVLDGIADVDVRLTYNMTDKKNYVYSKQVKPHYNGIWIGIVDKKLMVKKMFGNSEHLPMIMTFENYQDFEKYLRTLLSK